MRGVVMNCGANGLPSEHPHASRDNAKLDAQRRPFVAHLQPDKQFDSPLTGDRNVCIGYFSTDSNSIGIILPANTLHSSS
jgi:hypothetical protein